MRLQAENIEAGYGPRPVLHGVSLSIEPGQVVGIIGPNGSGKSTLLKVLGRLLQPTAGRVTLDGQPIHRMPPRAVARSMATLAQQPTAPPGLTVEELVAFGRHPHLAMFQSSRPEDRRCVESALDQCRLQAMRHRPVDTLSGGEQQRAWIAMALAQQPRILLLDEPVSALDINHQLELLTLLRRLNQERAATVVMVLHDLNLAARYCDRIVAMKTGSLLLDGTPREVTSPASIGSLFDVNVTRTRSPDGQSWQCHFDLAR